MIEKTIFIGSVYPNSMLNELLERKEHIDFAAHTFQSSLIDGLSVCYDKIYIISSPVTSPYPHSKVVFYRRLLTDDNGFGNNVSLLRSAFVNISIVRMISEFFEIRQLVKKKSCTESTVYVYALHSPFLLAVSSLRNKIGKACLIVPDLPEYMSNNKGLLRKTLKYINKKLINICIKSFDSFVLLSPYMKDRYPIMGKNWIQVEGIYSPSSLPPVGDRTNVTSKIKLIVYSGAISEKYGVFDLIKAFFLIEGEEYELLLCGGCQSQRKIFEKLISKDHRIKYLGMVSKEQVRHIQSTATLLVNPRHSTDDYTRYSFPSKTMEYLASGTATLMSHLPTIPKEYDDFLFYFEDESIEGMSKRIVEVCSLDSDLLITRGEKGRAFILNTKSSYVQARRIYTLVES